MIKVRVQYRNYKKLHNIYSSLVENPPKNVQYFVPKQRKYIKKFFPIYHHFSNYKFTKFLINLSQKHLFQEKPGNYVKYDLIHFFHMVPERIPNKPYIVDIQHMSAILNFIEPDSNDLERILQRLTNPYCKQIIFLSKASWNLFKEIYPEDYSKVENKKEIVYPASENFYELLKNDKDESLFTDEERKMFKLLLVGNAPTNKGFLEAYSACKKLVEKYPNIMLIAITKSKDIPCGYRTAPFLKVFEPNFSRIEMFKKFHLNSDLFLAPTRGDTFGMGVLEALACGLPVLGTNQFAFKEIIKPGVNGFLLNSEYNYQNKESLANKSLSNVYRTLPEDQVLTDELSRYIEKIYLDHQLLNELSKNTLKDFQKGGRFNVRSRSKKIGEIYNSIINSKI